MTHHIGARLQTRSVVDVLNAWRIEDPNFDLLRSDLAKGMRMTVAEIINRHTDDCIRAEMDDLKPSLWFRFKRWLRKVLG